MGNKIITEIKTFIFLYFQYYVKASFLSLKLI